MLGGLWEFPGGRVKDGETPQNACVREIREEVNLKVKIDSQLTRIRHAYTHFKIVMDVYSCRYVSGKVTLNGPTDHRWVQLDELAGFPFSKANLKGKKIGLQRATIHDNYLTDNYGQDVEVVRYGTQDEAYLDLVAGRVDMLLADSVAISDGFLKKPEGQDYQFIGPDLNDPKWFGEGTGIAIRKEDQDLVEMFNKAIKQIRADGTYKKIQDKYFDFNVYGE